ncbi:hypothetical protein GGS23DRAFT_579319 [Durotheca rogersii]|uniref:uncharacterized protein n=1 Tax=Durotheca rogersii TaxID=419775 RepID=UPI00221E6127|nr:uncharacterized protein GGS23DRAFT_579319 [Durotheca rogersii]KAI5860867.1 hypothetical protein GGS23DRAFT_579319 [Durotheca rogersii]
MTMVRAGTGETWVRQEGGRGGNPRPPDVPFPPLGAGDGVFDVIIPSTSSPSLPSPSHVDGDLAGLRKGDGGGRSGCLLVLLTPNSQLRFLHGTLSPVLCYPPMYTPTHYLVPPAESSGAPLGLLPPSELELRQILTSPRPCYAIPNFSASALLLALGTLARLAGLAVTKSATQHRLQLSQCAAPATGSTASIGSTGRTGSRSTNPPARKR